MSDYIIDQQDKFDDTDFLYEEFLKTKTPLQRELETQELYRKAYGKDLSGMLRNWKEPTNYNYMNNPDY